MAFRFAPLLLLATTVLAQSESPLYGQCGGIGWSGSTRCVAGAACVKLNDYFYQCQPSSTTIVQPPTSTQPPITTPPATTTQPPVTQPPITTQPPSGVCPTLPGTVTYSNSKLPDPFTFIDGSKVTNKSQWQCRAKEISELFQRYELGTFPPKPSSVTGTLSGTNLNINVSDAGKSISFSVGISYPSGNGPFPAIIAYGALSLPRPNGAAVITFNNDDIAAQQGTNSRGQGKFYTLYGNGHTASALTAWAWGVARIMDAIETTSNIRIDPARVAVTGCSRNGKGAIIAGAFEPRIALTIPQESGSGGAACWRLSDSQKSSGTNVQTASQIITENVWFSKAFEGFVNRIPTLPVDHNLLAALIAPRGLLVIENTSMVWLGNLSSYGCQAVGRKIYEALGVKTSMGVSQYGHSDHCGFPSAQNTELTAFYNRFLLGQTSTATDYLKTDGNLNFNEASWVDWSIPNLA